MRPQGMDGRWKDLQLVSVDVKTVVMIGVGFMRTELLCNYNITPYPLNMALITLINGFLADRRHPCSCF